MGVNTILWSSSLAIVCMIWIQIRATHGEFLTESHQALLEKCPDGYFGYKCGFKCQCKDAMICDKKDGSCPVGCKQGRWGPGCQLENGCFYNGQLENYMGLLSITENGKTCQMWNSQFPHEHEYQANQFPEKTYPRNYCRTPDSNRTWCYTVEEETRWEYCTTSNCACPIGRFGKNCENECHCPDESVHCEALSGICTTGCALGWAGAACGDVQDCPDNRYGFECEHTCYCKDPAACDRFEGPTSACECQVGYINHPHCVPDPNSTVTTKDISGHLPNSKEIVKLTERLLQAISNGDYSEYKNLVDPSVSSFEPEAVGYLVVGLDFHKFYFDYVLLHNKMPINTNILNPHVHLLGKEAACIAYVRLTQTIDRNGNPVTRHAEESRIWQRKNGKWLNVHFHRSGSVSTEK